MADFLQDLFNALNGTDVTAHAPDLGGDWLYQPGAGNGGTVLISNNRAYQDSTSPGSSADATPYNDADPGTPDYFVRGLLRRLSSAGCVLGVALRIDSAAKSCYFFAFNQFADQWFIAKYLAGTVTTLGAPVSQTLVDGTEYDLRGEAEGTALRLYVNDVLTCSATDSSLTAGFAGFITNTGVTTGTGLHLVEISAGTLGGGGAVHEAAVRVDLAASLQGAGVRLQATAARPEALAGFRAAGQRVVETPAALRLSGALRGAAVAVGVGQARVELAGEVRPQGQALVLGQARVEAQAQFRAAGTPLASGPLPPIRSYSARIVPAAAPVVAVAVPPVPRVSLSPSGPAVTLTD